MVYPCKTAFLKIKDEKLKMKDEGMRAHFVRKLYKMGIKINSKWSQK
jgi:hypothetical protein